MLVLVDYDNVPEADRRTGVDHVVRKLLALVPNPLLAGARPRVRLYGGWYEGDRLTKLGQRLSGEIRAVSPVRLVPPAGSAAVLADVELVFSTLVHPRTLVGNTYREQTIRDGIRCEASPWLQCADKLNCPMASLNGFFEGSGCAHTSCVVRPRDVLKRKEQKVVDTMIVADLAVAESCDYKNLCVLSRDDDIWPGLCLAALKATNLVHVTTASSTRVPKYYSVLTSPRYQLIQWS